MKREVLIAAVAFTLGGFVAPVAAQTAIRLFGTLEGTENTTQQPIALVADSDGKLIVECAP